TDPPATNPPATNPPATNPPATKSAGSVWIDPASMNVSRGSAFTNEVHAHSGTQKLAAYGVTLSFTSSILTVDTSIGTNGVQAGADGFVAAVNANTAGRLVISGFDTSGKGPGTDLHVCTVNWNASGSGTTTISVAVDSLVDENTNNIGTANGISGSVTVN
ncbi:MAG: hypothetical protein JW881_17440, partial [Spirochaetales bacterium]|nr:hypothetical protein [Spirochaetales bacterium]